MINQFQGLRVLAFLMIFIHHAARYFAIPHVPKMLFGEAVSFFFLLSGFLAGLKCMNGSRKNAQFLTYMSGKYKRFYLLMIVTLVLSPQFMRELMSGFSDTHFFTLVLHFAGLQAWDPRNYGFYAYNGLAWFLSTMMFLYALSIPLERLVARFSRIVCVLGIICLFVVSFGWCRWASAHELEPEYWLYVFPPVRLIEYAIGMLLGRILLSPHGKNESAKDVRLWTLLETVVLGIWLIMPFMVMKGRFSFTAVWLLPNAVLIAVLACGRGLVSRFLSWHPLVWLGGLTMPLYLVHEIVLRYLAAHMPSEFISPWGGLIPLSLSVLLAYGWMRFENHRDLSRGRQADVGVDIPSIKNSKTSVNSARPN